MNNKELVNELSSRLGYTNKDAATLVSSIVSIMGDGFSNGKKVSFDDFGQFEVKKKMERITVNPLTHSVFWFRLSWYLHINQARF